MSWSHLQNGSDIRGIALEGIEGESVNLTPEIVRTIGWSFSEWLKEKYNIDNPCISVGNDSRVTASILNKGVSEGIELSGGSVGDCGLSSTPAMFMSTILENHRFDGAIMLTASHLPYNRNGLKFFTCDGGLDKSDITSILENAFQKGLLDPKPLSRTTKVNIMRDYSEYLVTIIREGSGLDDPLSGLNIIVDAGNGAGGFFVESILKPLGADTTGSQFLDPDGMFPNHIPNPEDQDAMAAIIAAVKKQKADFGIIFDTDVDRAGAVDKNGKPINRNRFIALMATIVLDEYPETTIVTDSVTSSGLNALIKSLNGKHHRFKRGYKNVINEAIRLNSLGINCELALETSGHGALKENYFLDDGAYQIAKILIKIAKLHNSKSGTIDELISSLEEPLESIEYRPQITVKDFSEYADNVLEKFVTYVEDKESWNLTPNNFEGVHVTVPGGWILLRKSLHDPQLPINIECDIKGSSQLIKNQIDNFLMKFEHLKLS